MIEDFLVPPKSAKDIEQKALAWRDAFDVPNAWAPESLTFSNESFQISFLLLL